MIEDLSYSGLTNLIQGSVNEGRGAVIELSERFVDKQKEVEKLEKQLKRMKGDRDQLYGGVYKILQHLQINPPLAIKVDAGVINISEREISIQKNVL